MVNFISFILKKIANLLNILIENNLSFNQNLKYFLKSKGPSFFEVKIRSGSIKNLTRPKNLIKIKEDFIK
jgi:hypothetical protein